MTQKSAVLIYFAVESLKTGTVPPFYNTFWGIFDGPDVSGDNFCVFGQTLLCLLHFTNLAFEASYVSD